jgi:VIT1/CCC1 family predicted Fe2+/Mn2+ transporter
MDDMLKRNEQITNATLNRLRAAVLGANDGIVSVSSVVMGVAGATSNAKTIFTAGLAALVAGALSMAVGEYVSVSSQRDAEKIKHMNTHADHKDGDQDVEFTSPLQAAVASLLAFTVGGLVPFIAVIIAPEHSKIFPTIIAVIVGLVITGFISSSIAGSSHSRAISRVVVGGLIAMAVTYYVGTLFGTSLH